MRKHGLLRRCSCNEIESASVSRHENLLVLSLRRCTTLAAPLSPNRRRSTCAFSRSTIFTATCARRRAGSGSPIPRTRPKRSSCPAGGAEHMATLVKELREGHKNTIFVAAGDLIGASPFLSAMFHDEPTIESLSMMGLDDRLRRQSRVRRGQGRIAADAEWRLPSGRQMPGPASVHRRQIPLSRRQHLREDAPARPCFPPTRSGSSTAFPSPSSG